MLMRLYLFPQHKTYSWKLYPTHMIKNKPNDGPIVVWFGLLLYRGELSSLEWIVLGK